MLKRYFEIGIAIYSFSISGCSKKEVRDTSSINITEVNESYNNNESNQSNGGNKDGNVSNSGSSGNNNNNNVPKVDNIYVNPLQPTAEENSSLPKYVEPTAEKLETLNGKSIKIISGEIFSDLTLSAKYLWKISGETKIIGASLIIEAGTTLYFSDRNSSLSILNGGNILAVGSKTAPIILTSESDLKSKLGNSGDWSGLSIIKSEDSIIKYMIIKYAGYNRSAFEIQDSSSNNVIEFLEIYRSYNNGIELNGGTVNLRNIAFVHVKGDSLYINGGWNGKMQNILISQGDDATNESSGIELDFGSNLLATNIEIFSKNSSAGSGIDSKGGSIHLINSIITGERKGACLQWESVAGLTGRGVFEANNFGKCSGGFVSPSNSISISDTYNNFNSLGDDLRNSSKAINPYSLDSWFDEYNNLYVGAYIINNPWFKNWTIGLEDLE